MIGIQATSIYEPELKETAVDLAVKTGIPEQVIVEKFGLYEKRIAPDHLHASDLAIAAGKKILRHIDPKAIDVVIYFGSPYKDYPIWTASSKAQYELGTTSAYAFEMMNVSSCFPIAVKVAKDMIRSDESVNHILLVGGSKESMTINYENPRSRFMFNFADGGTAALVSRNATKSEILASSIITDGSFSGDVLVPGGGSVQPVSTEVVEKKLHFLDVPDPLGMKERLDPVSIPNFTRVIKQAVERSGVRLDDLKMLFPLHTKKSMFREMLEGVGLKEDQAVYLTHHGHMSALDPCYGLHLAERNGLLKNGDIAVIVSAGTGYTWAATAIRWFGMAV
ncbi:3-oxoacyl-ACP synthase [Oceanobacillus profundus]|uniref:3-oxoacyl-ACP synthase n=1 Tax=Oceanobacillus profundus TaxID=372463 RepID=A0A417YBT9_9BACI|nr:3-oxoacyl-ACP synthase [Oceanobacillus profundus]MBR3121184.1 3-oxoacyl-ACP synthase [Oceanobacillus sp.]PAE28053.1 3-oxoacyl-ACP synthase [Paenibacillus sp. 7884-2]MCM3397831.1 3-oxoacyl-ACP synthase [Oceanobacillus profundus]MDO6448939.1 3-oxoacyl-ACP synthase [Oceanobacillus profundus]RHW30065.1 3-oxoacyl-ACP synthase [Oceanobacillus profundus]